MVQTIRRKGEVRKIRAEQNTKKLESASREEWTERIYTPEE